MIMRIINGAKFVEQMHQEIQNILFITVLLVAQSVRLSSVEVKDWLIVPESSCHHFIVQMAQIIVSLKVTTWRKSAESADSTNVWPQVSTFVLVSLFCSVSTLD
jgi:hypothetical protein